MVTFIIPSDMVERYFIQKFVLRVGITFLILTLGISCSANSDAPQESIPTSEQKDPTQPAPSLESEIIPTIQASPDEDLNFLNPTKDFQFQDLVIWHGLDSKGTEAIGEIVNNFRRANPGFEIQTMYFPYDDLMDRFIQAAESGKGPDLLLGAGEWGATLYNEGVIKEIPEIVIRDLPLDINPPALSAIQYEDISIALPYSIHGVVMYRNKAIIPDAPKTFQELVISSQNVTKGRVIGAFLERGDLFAYAQLTACSGELVFPNGYPAFNNDSGLCWINLLEMFENAGPVSFNSDDDLDRFRAGNTGIIFAGTWQLPGLVESIGENLSVDPWPGYGDSHLSGYVWTENIYINSSLDEEEFDRALLFSQYFLSPEGQSILAEFRIIPATLYRDVRQPVILQTIAALMEGTPYPLTPIFMYYNEPMHEALINVFERGTAPSIALEQAEEEIIRIIDDFSESEDVY